MMGFIKEDVPDEFIEKYGEIEINYPKFRNPIIRKEWVVDRETGTFLVWSSNGGKGFSQLTYYVLFWRVRSVNDIKINTVTLITSVSGKESRNRKQLDCSIILEEYYIPKHLKNNHGIILKDIKQSLTVMLINKAYETLNIEYVGF